ncbi:MAG: hypothetical protein Ct9H300mP22_6320 [Gammaproteobacteria bacterium]|nr:MAG: hypothetical protein Ct9H300mP22_6320 [Gammaproteobacteria bacterium]
MHHKLAQVDPESAPRIHANDPQRLQRALEIFLVSGKTMTQLHAEEQEAKKENGDSLPFNFHFFAIQPEDRKRITSADCRSISTNVERRLSK